MSQLSIIRNFMKSYTRSSLLGELIRFELKFAKKSIVIAIHCSQNSLRREKRLPDGQMILDRSRIERKFRHASWGMLEY